MVRRGEIWWVDFGSPRGSEPGYRRPAVIISSDRFNRTRLNTVLVAAVTSNVALADLPGNLALEPDTTGLDRPSVVNVTQVGTVDRRFLDTRIGALPRGRLAALDAGLRLVLRL
ncbi:MAG: type II toxin-antitoxin system PemK/MazF family toxin [Pseudonocardia sp.]|nr:type II toxin-antitoxin system PemK/MazF family toxin [Pseudonocardia sp.]